MINDNRLTPNNVSRRIFFNCKTWQKTYTLHDEVFKSVV
jgi:hypothetical protein